MDKWAFYQAKYGKEWKISPFTYPLSVSLTANEKKTLTVTIDKGSVFEISKIKHLEDGPFRAEITVDQESFQNAPVHSDLWGNPIGLNQDSPNEDLIPYPLQVLQGRDLKITLTDISGSTNDVEVSIEGIHLQQ